MEDQGKDRLPNAIDESKVVPIDAESSSYPSSSLWRLMPGAIFVLVGLAVFAVVAASLNSHQRNLFLGGTAALLLFAFIFAALLVRSYNRDRRKFKEDNITELPSRTDRGQL